MSYKNLRLHGDNCWKPLPKVDMLDDYARSPTAPRIEGKAALAAREASSIMASGWPGLPIWTDPLHWRWPPDDIRRYITTDHTTTSSEIKIETDQNDKETMKTTLERTFTPPVADQCTVEAVEGSLVTMRRFDETETILLIVKDGTIAEASSSLDLESAKTVHYLLGAYIADAERDSLEDDE